MKIVFRTDASILTGSGHVMRCLTLADTFQKDSALVRFVCRSGSGDLGELIAKRGYQVSWLPANSSLQDDAVQTSSAIVDISPVDWLVVDHYALDSHWERQMRELARKILVIDDLADRPHDCDMLLDQNLQKHGRYTRLVPEKCRLLLGPKYALLRHQFAAVRESSNQRDGQVRRLLIFFGSTDTDGNVFKALAAIQMLNRVDVAVDVLVGQSNPHVESIETACRGQPNITLHRQVEDVASLMAKADLFLGAGGSSSWERCCVGLPAIVIATADNQIEQSKELARSGSQIYLGTALETTPQRIAHVLEDLLSLPNLLTHMSEQGRRLVDGNGATRVSNCMPIGIVMLRRAVASDSQTLFTWRNDPDTRRYSISSAEIRREEHDRWYSGALANPDQELLIAMCDEESVGVLRYDIEKNYAKVSIYLRPGMTGRGLGVRMLRAGEDWLRHHRPAVATLQAEILLTNQSSLSAFQSAGFVQKRAIFQKEIHDCP